MKKLDFIVESSKIFPEVKIFTPTVNIDERGTIFTTYVKEYFQTYLPEKVEFIHDKFAESKKNVLRGLHGDYKTWKLVTCLYGEIFEVVVDIRLNSSTYMHWDSFYLNSENKKLILVPPSFVNGYCVLSDFAIFHYKLAYQGEYIDADKQIVIKWNDERLNIKWPIKNPILQDRDK